ncbi:MAG: hypothetical protein AAF234_01405 [Pseudomonadota bacterium]
MTVRSIAVLAFALLSVSSAFAQSPVITFYQIGAELRFEAEDVVSVQFLDAEQEEHGEIAITLTPTMSQRLQAFTERLVGRTIMTVSQGHVLSADISVRTTISGRVIHVSGSDKAILRHMVERLDGLRNSGEPLLVTYEQISRVDIEASLITMLRDGDDPDSWVLRIIAEDQIADALLAEPAGWIAAIDGDVVQIWSVEDEGEAVHVTLHDLAPAHRALLRRAAGEDGSELQ